VLVLRLEGTGNLRTVVDLQYLSRLDVPMVVLLDNVRPRFRERHRRTWTEEEQKVAGLEGLLGRPMKIVSHSLPDMICALPERAVRAVVPDFPGWADTIARYEAQSPRPKLKKYLGEALGLRNEFGNPIEPGTPFIRAVLNATTNRDDVAAGLNRAVDEALAHITASDAHDPAVTQPRL
jgi:hypothetical protein